MTHLNFKKAVFYGLLFVFAILCPIFVFGADNNQVVYVKFKKPSTKNEFLKNNPKAQASKIKNLVRYKPSNFLDSKIFALKTKNKDIEYSEAVEMVKPFESPNDTYFNSAWYFSKIDAIRSWNVSKGSANHTIAVIDTGVQLNHPDLDSKIWTNSDEIAGNLIDDDGNGYIDDVNGYDFADNDANPSPDLTNSQYAHGTKVSGVAAAETNNGQGVAGISWYAKIMPLKVFESGQPGGTEIGAYPDDIALAIRYATDNSAKIVNISLGTYSNVTEISNAVDYAYSRGVVLVAAAGNDNRNYVSYPARYSKVISVGSINSSGKKALFSNYGTGLDLFAPGEGIYTTTTSSNYTVSSGTSFSSPIVSGKISVLLNNQTNLTYSQIKAKLTSLGNPVSCYSNKRLNLYKVVKIKLVKSYTSSPYFIDGWKKYRMWDSTTSYQRFGLSTSMIETISEANLNLYAYSGYLSGLWKESNGNLYFIDRSKKFSVYKTSTFFDRWGFRNSDIRNISDSLLALYPTDKHLTGIVKSENSSTIYYVDKGQKKYPVSQNDIFWGRWGFNREDVTTLSSRQLASMKTEKYLSGLVKGESSSQIYYIDLYGKKFNVPDNADFWTNWGFSYGDIVTISDKQIDFITYAGQLQNVVRGDVVGLYCKMSNGKCPIYSPQGEITTTISQGQFNFLER